MILLGIDPGLAHCGVATLEILNGKSRYKLIDLSVYETKPGKFDARLEEHRNDMGAVIRGVERIAIEYPSYPPSPSNAVKLFSSYVTIRLLAAIEGVPCQAFMPGVWRRYLGLPARETTDERKADVAEYCERLWGASRFLSKIKNNHEEHALDALAVASVLVHRREKGDLT